MSLKIQLREEIAMCLRMVAEKMRKKRKKGKIKSDSYVQLARRVE
jgi:hypothetical protein